MKVTGRVGAEISRVSCSHAQHEDAFLHHPNISSALCHAEPESQNMLGIKPFQPQILQDLRKSDVFCSFYASCSPSDFTFFSAYSDFCLVYSEVSHSVGASGVPALSIPVGPVAPQRQAPMLFIRQSSPEVSEISTRFHVTETSPA